MNAAHGVPAGTQLRRRVEVLQGQLAASKMNHKRTKKALATARAEVTRLRRQIRFMERQNR